MKPTRAALRAAIRALGAHGVAQRKILRIARKLNPGSMDLLSPEAMFPGVSDDQLMEIDRLATEMDELEARVFALLPIDCCSTDADLRALANALAYDDLGASEMVSEPPAAASEQALTEGSGDER